MEVDICRPFDQCGITFRTERTSRQSELLPLGPQEPTHGTRVLFISEGNMMTRLNTGDPVKWNSDVGHVTGRVTKIHKSDFEFMGRTRRASEDDPQYVVESDKTGNKAAHHGSALTKTD
jgi:hypothetical protein